MHRLKLESFSVARASRPIITNIDVGIKRGELIALVGANGSGKSTLLHAMAGLLDASGTLLFDGQDLKKMESHKRAQTLTLLLQSSPPHPYCIAQNRIAQGLIPHRGFSPWLDAAATKAIARSAKALQIAHLLDRPLAKMSGGELRLVNIAKCLVNEATKLILLDEPSVYLDFAQKENLARTLQTRAENGAVIVFSSHDRSFIEQCAHRVFSLKDKSARLLSVTEFFMSAPEQLMRTLAYKS